MNQLNVGELLGEAEEQPVEQQEPAQEEQAAEAPVEEAAGEPEPPPVEAPSEDAEAQAAAVPMTADESALADVEADLQAGVLATVSSETALAAPAPANVIQGLSVREAMERVRTAQEEVLPLCEDQILLWGKDARHAFIHSSGPRFLIAAMATVPYGIKVLEVEEVLSAEERREVKERGGRILAGQWLIEPAMTKGHWVVTGWAGGFVQGQRACVMSKTGTTEERDFVRKCQKQGIPLGTGRALLLYINDVLEPRLTNRVIRRLCPWAGYISVGRLAEIFGPEWRDRIPPPIPIGGGG